MRSVSYVQRVALEFSGSLFPHAICLGDVDNDTNLVVAVSAEGWFHLCDLTPAKALDASGHHESLTAEEQHPVFKQHIPANTKVMLISDIGGHGRLQAARGIGVNDGDGRCELVVGYTDRVVRAFRWEDLGEGTEHPMGQLVSLKKWTLEGQVDSLSVTPGPLGVPELMVSQPGCAYAILLCTWNKDTGPPPTSEGALEGSRDTLAARDVMLHQTSGRIHNKNVSTHLVGNIKRGEGHTAERAGSGLFALCTLDGTLKLMEEADKLLWSVQVDHQLFALEKLDVTETGNTVAPVGCVATDARSKGNGHEEVVACAWDGQTYIIDHNRTVVRFQVDENIRAFCAGLYACKEGRNSPCLVYVTFNQKIYVYWEVQLERMESTNLLKLLEAEPEFQNLLQELGVDPDDVPAVRTLLHQTLYHPDQPPQCAPASLHDPT
ncbi:KICSTOR complex protein ITFG2 isoform X8 [Mustela erminea]|uniref:KICSTOR complex protein ITFG2 isoform X8 n=1 Tax=Mustela erminea TaxID=36723 RepID=UPI001386A0A4|nr:KICSTOR complex protein ITFG2 isoform X8 [Mustela erminea]